MRQTDVLIIGGGLAGSTAAAMLGRAGIATIMVDPHEVYPPDFRCEKFDASQVALLEKTGLADAVLPATTASLTWAARPGGLVDKKPVKQFNALYDTLVNAMRRVIGGSATMIEAKAAAMTVGAERQTVQLSTGEEISARLLVLANGLNAAIRQNLGMGRTILSANHSISAGFDVTPVGRPHFDFPAMTFFPTRASERLSYLTLFPIGATMRANLFVYRDMNDPWLRQLREAPVETLTALIPALARFAAPFAVPDPVKIRPVDLYATTGYEQAGVVLVGDAFATSCPAAGTGTNKVLTDVERLCHEYIPRWLATPGMGFDKIAAFYADPEKVACDKASLARAFYVRSISVDESPAWQARRFGKTVGRIGISLLRSAAARASAGPSRHHAATGA